MTQDESWNRQYEKILNFMRTNKHRPSKHRIEEHQMLNWIKYNKKLLRSGQMPANRTSRFKHLLEVADELRRINQYA